MRYEKNDNRLIIDYRRLGTVSRRELIDAIIQDILMIEEEFGVRFYTGAKLFLWASDEYGSPRLFQRQGGGRVTWLHTTHYRPACLDYDI
jgi:hypothetical protein